MRRKSSAKKAQRSRMVLFAVGAFRAYYLKIEQNKIVALSLIWFGASGQHLKRKRTTTYINVTARVLDVFDTEIHRRSRRRSATPKKRSFDCDLAVIVLLLYARSIRSEVSHTQTPTNCVEIARESRYICALLACIGVGRMFTMSNRFGKMLQMLFCARLSNENMFD